jgi:hypothetical protein
MEIKPQCSVADAERVNGDVAIEFESGECALYSAALLHSLLSAATQLGDAAEEDWNFHRFGFRRAGRQLMISLRPSCITSPLT